MPDLQPAPKYAAYPRGPARRYGSADRLESLGAGLRGLFQLIPVVPAAALVLAIFPNRGFILALAYLFVFATFAGSMALSTYGKVLKGMGVSKLFAVLPTIFFMLTPVLYLLVGQATRWGVTGYFCTVYTILVISLAIVETELKRYGLGCRAIPTKGFQNAIAVAARERRRLEANAGIAPAPENLYSGEGP